MMTEDLKRMLEKFSQDLPLSKIGPPFLNAYTVSYISSQASTEEQKPIIEAIEARYRELREAEIREALTFEGAIEKRDAYKIYNLYMNEFGYLVPGSETYVATLSSPCRDDGEEKVPEGLVATLASSIFDIRVDEGTEYFEAFQKMNQGS
ncbi:MAG: hypothetical protein IJ865_05615 [Clostridia bacterium]|nr:hypothetical protein [Clostridia bacterium]